MYCTKLSLIILFVYMIRVMLLFLKLNIKMGNCIGNRTICMKKTRKNESLSPKSEYSEKEIVLPKKKAVRISRQSWINILDYLYFRELKEIGKVNRQLNSLAKSSDVLLKFFKKKNYNNNLNYVSYCNYSTTILRGGSFCEISEYKN